MKRTVVVAMENELDLVGQYDDCIVTGIGALNVISALGEVDRSTPIRNVGYVGSNKIRKGETVRVGPVCLYHPNVNYEEPNYRLDGDVACYTSSDFVTSTDMDEPCVFDMELAYILAMGFTDVTAEKVVSDNLDMGEYMRTIERGSQEERHVDVTR